MIPATRAFLTARRYQLDGDMPNRSASSSTAFLTDCGSLSAARARHASPGFRAFCLPVLPCGFMVRPLPLAGRFVVSLLLKGIYR